MNGFDFTSFNTSLTNFFLEMSGNPLESMIQLFANGGWIIFLIVFMWGMFLVYMRRIKRAYLRGIKWAYLAIDIPQENLQSTKAVEHIFAAMWPFYESYNLIEKYIQGMFQLCFSLEIVSIGGYTQFIIRVPQSDKDIVEAAVYGQYPKAEISEVEDYTLRYTDLKFPSDEYDIWGSEFGLKMPSPYPIRTYPAFEHTLTQTFADPMASLLEVFNSINKGEELWMQILITPISDNWKQEGNKIIDKIIGATHPAKKGMMDAMLYPFYYLGTLVQELFIYGIGYEPGMAQEGAQARELNQPPNKMLYLTPEERNVVDGITMKISKIGYRTKLRAIYLGRKGKLNKPKGVAAFIGALQQFSTLDLNQFVPIMKTFTKANYFFAKRRVAMKQNNIFKYFRDRSQTYGWGKGFVFNIEELASIFHFPVPEALRESVKTVGAKKEAAPVDLPDTVYEEEEVARREAEEVERQEESAKAEPPADLPI